MRKVASIIIIIIGLLSIVLLVSLGTELFKKIPREPERELRVAVLNGTSIDRLAANTADYLREYKCDILQIGNASSYFEKTVIIDRRDRELSNAEYIHHLLRVGEMTFEPDQGEIVDVTVILGEDYKPIE